MPGGVNGGSGNDGGAGGRSVDEWDVSAAREAQFAEDAVVQALVAETTALIRVGARGEGFVSRNPCSVSKPDANDAGPTADDVSSLEASFTALFSEMGKKHARVSVAETESLIRESCVVAFATRELAGCAFMDMTARASYYASLLDVVDAVAWVRRRIRRAPHDRKSDASSAARNSSACALLRVSTMHLICTRSTLVWSHARSW